MTEILGRLIDVWHCPTTGRVIEGLVWDDKVLCGCRRSNPRLPQERTELTGTHVKRFLEPATEADWRAQIESDDAKETR
jgi:hypothetical protein